jgi:hypothetical protein
MGSEVSFLRSCSSACFSPSIAINGSSRGVWFGVYFRRQNLIKIFSRLCCWATCFEFVPDPSETTSAMCSGTKLVAWLTA